MESWILFLESALQWLALKCKETPKKPHDFFDDGHSIPKVFMISPTTFYVLCVRFDGCHQRIIGLLYLKGQNISTRDLATWKPMASKPLSGETTKIDKQLNLRGCIWRGKIWKCHSPFSHVGESDRSKSLGRSSIFCQFYEINTCIYTCIYIYAVLLCHQSLPLQTLCAFFFIRHLRILLGWPCLRLWHGKSGALGGSCENKWSRCAWPPLRHAHVQGKVSLTITFVLLFMLIWFYLIVCFLTIFWCFCLNAFVPVFCPQTVVNC